MNKITYNPIPAEPQIEVGTMILMCDFTYIVAQHTGVERPDTTGISLINIATGGRWSDAVDVEGDWHDEIRNTIRKNQGTILAPGTQLTIVVG